MPLVNKVEHPPGASSLSSFKPTDDVFVLQNTGDVVKTFSELVEKKYQHSQLQWTDKYYGKSGLSYQDALAYEKHAEEHLRKQVRVTNTAFNYPGKFEGRCGCVDQRFHQGGWC